MSGGKSGSKLSSFKNLKQIGQGGFGIVYSAQRENGEKVAIKKIGKAAAQSRIREEIKTMKQLDHRNIVKFYEAFVDNDETYLVMELCEGGSLISYVKEKGPLDDSTAVQILRQLISAVTFIHHKNKLHRDLSAGNVFIKDATKSKITVKLGDFGLATNIGRGETACTIVGTPGYIAPQVYHQNYDQSADVYSLGAVLYTMLTARSPPAKGRPNTYDIRNRSAAKLVDLMMHPDVKERIPLREIVMADYMKENTDEEARLYSREHSRDSRRQRSREPIRSREPLSQERRPLVRSNSQPVYSARHSNRIGHDRMPPEIPSTSRGVVSTEQERGRERHRHCGEGLGPSRESHNHLQIWPIRMDRLAGQRIRTAGGRYIVEMDTRCRFEVASHGDIVRRILIVEVDQYQKSQTVYVHRITDRIVQGRNEKDELVELTKNPIVYTSQSQLPKEVLNDYMRLQKMIVSNLASRVAKITFRRPSQFPDAHAQLMENGDLRIKLPKSIIVRKKENGEIYNCIDGMASKKEEVSGLSLTKVKEVYTYLIRFDQCLQGMSPGMVCFPIVFSAGPEIIGSSNNSPSSMLPPSSRTSRIPFSTVGNQLSLLPHSAPQPTKPLSSHPQTANMPRWSSTDENVAPIEKQSKYKMKIDPATQKVRSIQASDGRVLRCSTAIVDQFIFSDPSINPNEQRFMRNGRVPERATEMLSKLLERIRAKPKI